MNEKVDFEESYLVKKKKEIKKLECESDDEFQAFGFDGTLRRQRR